MSIKNVNNIAMYYAINNRKNCYASKELHVEWKLKQTNSSKLLQSSLKEITLMLYN